MSLADGRNIALCMFMSGAIGVVLLPGVALFFAIKGLRILKRKMVPYIHQFRFYLYRIERAVDRGSRAAVKPIVVTAATTEQIKFYMNRVFSILSNQED